MPPKKPGATKPGRQGALTSGDSADDEDASAPGQRSSKVETRNGQDDGDLGEDDGVTAAEYNKWLVLEGNWESAEATRQRFMEGSQLRKSRDERHRERGLGRQAKSIEQMKQAKGKVEEHREHNLEQGKVVREGVQSLKEAMYTQQQEWLEHGKRLKNHHANVERQKAEREALLTLKKKLSLQVRNEVEQLTKDSRLQKSNLLDSNRSSAGKIRMETADQVTDNAKKFMYEQRKSAALATAATVKDWDEQRRSNKLKFRENAAGRRDASKRSDATARNSRKQLQEQRQREADAIRDIKKQVLDAHRQRQEERAAIVKQLVYASVADKFATPQNSRRMLQHPHYQEVTAVITDVTSQISKEIAASPRRRPISVGRATAALRMSPSASARK